MEGFFDIIIALAVIGGIIIRIAKKAQENAKEQEVFREENVFFDEETPKTTTENFNRTTRSTEYAKAKNVFASPEGTASQEGTCIEPNADHCVMDEHIDDVIYATQITDEQPVFTRENLVQGIIMAEILSKPKWKE